MRKRLSKSVRKCIRRQKARIRREVLNSAEQKKRISEIYDGLVKKQLKEYGKNNEKEDKGE